MKSNATLKILTACLLFCVSLEGYSGEGSKGLTCSHSVLQAPSSKISLSAGLEHKNSHNQVTYKFNFTMENTVQYREYSLPSAIDDLQQVGVDAVVVFAGNGGEAYEWTNHNYAQIFYKHLLNTHKDLSSHLVVSQKGLHEFPKSRTLVHPTYQAELQVHLDNGETLQWKPTLITEPHTFRSKDGEIFYIPEYFGKKVLFVHHFGDYNEVGDFVVPLLERLKLDSRSLVLVRDDIDVPPGEFRNDHIAMATPSGNNAKFSLVRNLGYRIIRLVQEKLQAEKLFDAPQTKLLLDSYIGSLREFADVRYQGHLNGQKGKPDYSKAYRTSGHIKESLKILTADLIKKYARVRTELEIEKVKAQYVDLQAQIAQLGKKLGQADSNKTLINSEMKDLKAKQLELIKEARKDIDRLESLGASGFSEIVDAELHFRELLLGVGRPPEGTPLVDFVLGLISKQLIGPEARERAFEKLKEILL